MTRVDRRSGARSTPDGGFDPESLSAAPSPLGAGLGTSVSPDGDVLLVRLPVASTDSAGDTPAVDGWFLADTARGRLTVVDDFDAGQPVVWSADSNFAAVLADSTCWSSIEPPARWCRCPRHGSGRSAPLHHRRRAAPAD